MSKRLARKIKGSAEDLPVLKPTVKNGGIDLYVAPYSDKSIVVTGDTNTHSAALVTLGGSFNTGLRIGAGWIFAKTREESVRHYIETGDIKPFVYSKTDRQKYASKGSGGGGGSKMDEKMLLTMFQEFKDAFDADGEYDGQSVHEVIFQLQEKYMVKTTPKNADNDNDED